MEFIRKNYAKIILSLALLGLAGVLVAMWFVITADQEQMANMREAVIHQRPVPLPPLDLSRQQAVLERLKSPDELDFTTTNKLFNPVLWQKTRDGRIVKATGLGPNAAAVTKITPLYYIISLDSVETNSLGVPPRYTFTVERQAAILPAQRHPQRQYASKGEKVRDFLFEDIKGPPENPDRLILKLADTGLEATLSKDKPFQRVDGYSADLKYPPENFSRTGLRVGDQLGFAGDDYNVIAIDENEVILLAQSNQKKYILRYAP